MSDIVKPQLGAVYPTSNTRPIFKTASGDRRPGPPIPRRMTGRLAGCVGQAGSSGPAPAGGGASHDMNAATGT
jgi:hypothetical protein